MQDVRGLLAGLDLEVVVGFRGSLGGVRGFRDSRIQGESLVHQVNQVA